MIFFSSFKINDKDEYAFYSIFQKWNKARINEYKQWKIMFGIGIGNRMN